MVELPMPNERVNGATVVASAFFGDDGAILLLLRDSEPYYAVVEWDRSSNRELHRLVYPNIMPASQAYNDLAGVW